MASLIDFLKKESQIIELGEVVQIAGSDAYLVSIEGVDRVAFNTLGVDLSVGNRVIVNKVNSGKRFIISQTGFIGKFDEIKEVYRDG